MSHKTGLSDQTERLSSTCALLPVYSPAAKDTERLSRHRSQRDETLFSHPSAGARKGAGGPVAQTGSPRSHVHGPPAVLAGATGSALETLLHAAESRETEGHGFCRTPDPSAWGRHEQVLKRPNNWADEGSWSFCFRCKRFQAMLSQDGPESWDNTCMLIASKFLQNEGRISA